MTDTEIALLKQRMEQFEAMMDRMEETLHELKSIQQSQMELMATFKTRLCPAPGSCSELRNDVAYIEKLSDEREKRLRENEQLTAVLGESLRSMNEAITALAKTSKFHGESLAGIRAQSSLIAILITVFGVFITKYFKL